MAGPNKSQSLSCKLDQISTSCDRPCESAFFSNVAGKQRKVLILGLKAEKHLQNENHTEDWKLGSHPRDNGHVTH